MVVALSQTPLTHYASGNAPYQQHRGNHRQFLAIHRESDDLPDIRHETVQNLLAQPHIRLADAAALCLPMKTPSLANKCQRHDSHATDVWELR